MEWLMEKARGVSKNFMSSSSSSLNAMSPLSPSSPQEMSSALNQLSNDKPDYLQPEQVKQALYLPHGLTHEKLVTQPSFIDRDEWIASHVIGLFENVNNVYEAIYDLCLCDPFVNQIIIEDKTKRSSSGAREYLDSLLSQCYEMIESDKIFPKKNGHKFPSHFQECVAKILRNLLPCITHLYLSHFSDLVALEFVAHLNTITTHYLLFTTRHNFVDERFLGPLKALQEALLEEDIIGPSTTSVNEP